MKDKAFLNRDLLKIMCVCVCVCVCVCFSWKLQKRLHL